MLIFVMQREPQGMDNTEKLQYILLKLKNIYKLNRLKGFEDRMVVLISDKRQDYNNDIKLLVKPTYSGYTIIIEKIIIMLDS